MAVDLAVNGATATVTNSTFVNGNIEDLFYDSDMVSSTIIIDGTKQVRVAKIGDTYYETLAAAIADAKDNTVITLVADATMSYGAREAYGAADLATLTIDGAGHILTLNQTNSDWSSIGLKNAEGTLVLKNMTINKSGKGATSGAWNTHAIIFSTPVEMNNVTVNNAIAVCDDATLKNVTINEANGYYGLWIEANGQNVTVEGGSITATNGGRGIKIADQYINEPESVTLTVSGTVFNTAKKAAVLVSSVAGADITANNVDISGVVADPVNFVWVDEDYAADFNKVTVNDAPAAQENVGTFVAAFHDEEGAVIGYYATLQDAVDAAQTGETVDVIKDVVLTETLVIPAAASTFSLRAATGITLDLNGNTISMADASGAAAALLKNNGILTIKDSSAEKTGMLSFSTTTPSATNGYASNTISNYGVLTIESGSIVNSGNGGACYALDNYAGSTATIKGGKLIAEKTAVRVFNWTNGEAAKAVLNVEAGEILSKDGYGINFNMGNAPTVELNISGGTITTNDTDYNLAAYIVSKGDAKNVTINVTGGTFNGYFALNGTTCVTMAADNVAITGGTFQGVVCYGTPAYGFIFNGTYKECPDDNTLAAGYATKYDKVNRVFVIETAAVASVNGKEYATLTEAIEAAKNGGTIYLISNVVLNGKVEVPAGAEFTLNMMGYTLNGSILAPNAKMTILDGTIKNTDKNVSAIEINAGKLTLTNVNVASERHALRIDGNVDATINGGEYKVIGTNKVTYHAMNVSGNATVAIKDGTFVGPKGTNADSGSAVNVQAGATVIIEGGSFSGGKTKTLASKGNLSVIGGTFDQDPSAYVAKDYKAVKNDDKFEVVKKVYVAMIGENGYESLAEALAAAEDGETITLIWAEGDAPIAMNGAVYGKTVTITGTATVDWNKGWLFIGRGGEGNGTIIFDNANLTSASNSSSFGINVSGREKNTNNKYDGTLVIKNSNIELDYLINKGTIDMDASALTVKNGFAVGGRSASETESGADATATLNLTNGSKVIVNNHNGMGLGYEAIGVMNIDATSSFETTKSFLVTAKGTMNIAGTAKVAGTLTNNGSIVLTAPNAVLTANECGNVTTELKDYNVSYADGTYKLVAKDYVAQIGEAKYESLQAAINAAVAGDNTITLLADTAENVTVKQTEGVNVVIDGNHKVYSGTITIHGAARHDGAETLTLKNFKFETSEASHYFIDSNSTASAERYAHNVTVQDSSFTATGAAVNSAVAMRIRQGFNIAVKNVKADGLHSVLQAYGTNGIAISDLTATNMKNGISAGTSTNVEITNAIIDATGYGIRADGEVATELEVTGSTINAAQPIVVRKNSNADYAVVLDGNTLTATEGEYHVIFTTGADDAAYVAPTHAANVTGAEGLNVFPKTLNAADFVLVDALTYNGTEQTQAVVSQSGATFNVTGNTGTNAGVYTMTITGHGEYNGTVEVEWTIAKKAATITANALTMVEGNAVPTATAQVEGTVNGETLNYTVAIADVDITNPGEYDVVVTLGENPNYDVTAVNGKLTVQKAVAKVGTTNYATLKAAVAGATAGDTITFLADIEGNVKVTKNVTIDGAGFKYTGTMTMDKDLVVTVQNVNFVKGCIETTKTTKKLTVKDCNFDGVKNFEYYAVTMRGGNSVTIENCTAKHYYYGMLYVPNAVTNVTVKDSQIVDAFLGINIAYGSKITLDGVKTSAVEYSLQTHNYGAKTITIRNCDLEGKHAVCVYDKGGNGIDTFIFEGKNIVNALDIKNAKVVLRPVGDNVADALLITPEVEGLNISTNYPGYDVAYDTAAYKLVEKNFVAQIGDNGQKFESLAEAVEAAKTGDIVKVIADHEANCNDNPLINVAGKDITIDLNGKTIIANVVASDATRSIFQASEGAKLTMTDSVGTGTVIANGEGVLHYMFRNEGEMIIDGGNYELSGLNGGAMFYATNSNMTVTGGMFTQTTNGWMFNTAGNGVNVITVSGGTFNRYFIGSNTVEPQENIHGEVVLDEGLALVKSEIYAGYWTINEATVKRVGANGAEKTYISLAAALAEAVDGDTFVLLAVNAESVSIDKNVALDLNGFNYTGEITLTAVVALTADETLNVVTNVADHKVVYAEGAHNVVEMVYVAQVGEAKFESLAEAVEAAKTGDTVKVIADHEIPCDVTPLITVSGKDITIDLNGKTITVNAVGAATTVRVVFQAEKDAKLTMTDSVGTGTVIANGKGVIYYMFRNVGAMDIAGGNYELSAYTGGAMFFSMNGNMTVTGGMFTQKTSGWMFNTDGNGKYVITVYGGTFNRYFIGGKAHNENEWNEAVLDEGLALVESEIDGYWTIGEAAAKRVDADGETIKAYATLAAALAEAAENDTIVLLADIDEDVTIDKAIELVLNRWYYTGTATLTANATLTAPNGLDVITDVETAKVVYNEDGYYEVIEWAYVAQIGETKYESLNEALAEAVAGDVIKVIAPIVEKNYVIIDGGVTLDLNGFRVELTRGIVAFNGNHIVDNSADNSGVLAVNKNRFVIDSGNKQLPIWNGEGYQFFAMNGFNTAAQPEKSKFIFQPLFDADAHELIAKGSDYSGVTVTVRLTWNVVNENGEATGEIRSQDFVYTDAQVKGYVESFGAKKPGKYGQQFSLLIGNTDHIGAVTINVVLKTDCGVQVVSDDVMYQ